MGERRRCLGARHRHGRAGAAHLGRVPGRDAPGARRGVVPAGVWLPVHAGCRPSVQRRGHRPRRQLGRETLVLDPTGAWRDHAPVSEELYRPWEVLTDAPPSASRAAPVRQELPRPVLYRSWEVLTDAPPSASWRTLVRQELPRPVLHPRPRHQWGKINPPVANALMTTVLMHFAVRLTLHLEDECGCLE